MISIMFLSSHIPANNALQCQFPANLNLTNCVTTTTITTITTITPVHEEDPFRLSMWGVGRGGWEGVDSYHHQDALSPSQSKTSLLIILSLLHLMRRRRDCNWFIILHPSYILLHCSPLWHHQLSPTYLSIVLLWFPFHVGSSWN